MTVLSYSVAVAGSTVTSTALTGGTISYGRQRTIDRFPPATAFVRFLNPATPWSVGDTLTITVGAVTRFDGRIVALATNQEITTVTAISEGLGYLSAQWCPTFTQRYGSSFDYIVWTLGQALLAAGIIEFGGVAQLGTSGSTVMDNGKTFESGYNATSSTYGPQLDPNGSWGASSALDACYSIVENSSYPLFYELPNGTVRFEAPSARSGTSTSFALNPGDVVRSSTATQNIDSLLNRAIVDYTGGTRTIIDRSSVALYGRRDFAVDTQLVDVDDAALKASRIVGSNSNPYWLTNPVTLLVNQLSLAETTSLLAARAGTLLNTSAIASLYPGMEDQSYVEGWVERFGAGSTTFDLYLSPWSMTRKPEAWYEVTASLAWNGAAIVGLDWLDLIRQDI